MSVALDEAAFRAEAERRGGAVLALAVDELETVRRTRGEPTARRLLGRLELSLHALLSEGELAGPFEGGLALSLRAEDARARAAELLRRLREEFRFPVSLGLAAGGDPRDLCERAARALREAVDAGGNRLHLHAGGALEAAAAPAGGGAPENALAERYQKLVLLNHFALGLFAKESLEASLGAVGHNVLALTGAKYFGVHRIEGSSLQALHRMGDARFRTEEAAGAERALIEQVRRERKPAALTREEIGLFAMPAAAAGADSHLAGIVVVGFPRSAGVRTDAASHALEEVARLLYNALVLEGELRRERTLAAMLDQSADPVILMDLEGRITLWSRTAAEFFGHAAERTLRQPLEELLVPADRRVEHRKAAARALERGTLRDHETLYLRADGELVPVELTMTRIDDEKDRPFALLLIVRDLRRRQELERLKTELVNVVSHELRGPLTSIRGFSETLLEYGEKMTREERGKQLEVIARESARLARLLTDFLDVSRLESGGARLERAPADLAELAARVAETFAGHPSGVRVELDFESGLPKASVDADGIQRVLLNLVGNALKYSPRGGRVLIAGRRRDDELECSVADEGPGIPEAARGRIFQRFFRAGDEATRRLQGAGLGLYIVKGIVEAHGGSIGFDSPGRGTRFWFRLPLA
ncbi:MAG: ATP-binding protein [Elusimicrobiota bacterium]|jgi:PAS domain S-box-containing protein